ncbi:hypothetical protein D3C73_1281970 [compost metagenome]
MNKQAVEGALNDVRRSLNTQVTALQTQTRVIQQILRTGTTLWVLAPATTQRASLKEDYRADTGTIVGGIALDIENHKRPLFFRIKIKLLSNESYIDVSQLTARFRRATVDSC